MMKWLKLHLHNIIVLLLTFLLSKKCVIAVAFNMYELYFKIINSFTIEKYFISTKMLIADYGIMLTIYKCVKFG